MAEAIAESRPRLRDRLLNRGTAWLLVVAIFTGVALGLFFHGILTYGHETERELRLIPYLPYTARVDFAYFYAGASMAWHGEAFDLYPKEGEITYYPGDPIFNDVQDDYEKARLLARGNYYNPPALAYMQAPLAALSFRDALWLFTGLSVTALGGFMVLAFKAGRGIAETPLLIAGVAAFKPVHEVLIMGHIALFLTLALTAGFLALRAKKSYLAGLCLSLLALKPQWAILPALFLIVRGDWKALATMTAAATAIFILPFFATGLTTLHNYETFLRTASAWDIKDSPHMFSWNGFLFKLFVHPLDVYVPTQIQPTFPWPWFIDYATFPQPWLIYSLIGLTALLLGIVWLSRDFYLSAAATVIAMLLVSTHSVWYDWALLVVAALFLILRPMRRNVRVELWVVLLVLYVAASQSMAALLYPDRHLIDWHRHAFYAITPAAFGALAWIALLGARDKLVRLPTLPFGLGPRLRRRRSQLLPAGS